MGLRFEALKEFLPVERQKKLHIHVVDGCDSTQVDSLASTLPAEFSQVTILVNNAGFALGLERAHKAFIPD